MCLRLVNELAAIDSAGGFNASPRYRQYQRAVEDQRAQIAKTRQAARRNGCEGAFGLFRSNASLCGRIAASLRQMRSNLADLERTLARLGPGGGNSARRQALLQEIDFYGCQMRNSSAGARAEFEGEGRERRRSLLEQIFGVRTFGDTGYSAGTEYDPDSIYSERYGTYRTLCVRTCDGYYFPISFSTVAERFGQDEQTCQNMCPGTEVELYYHRMPSQDSEDMISVRGDIPYSELPTAFDYRKSYHDECTCRFRSNIMEVAGSGGGISPVFDEPDLTVQEEEKPPPIATPVYRVDPGRDPEAVANAEGRLTEKDLERLVPRPDLLADDSKSKSSPRQIRIVGPAFFPVQ